MDHNKNDLFEIGDEFFKDLTAQFGINTRHISISGNIKIGICLPSSFTCYKNSGYYTNPRGMKLIHYTSMDTLSKIFDSGFILATRFDQHQDKYEINFAGEALKDIMNLETINDIKQDYFSLSMCAFTEEKESSHMWEKYGRSGNGIGIVISFYDNSDFWSDYSFFSSIYYGNEGNMYEKFIKMKEDYLAFKKKYPDKIIESAIGAADGFPIALTMFLAFHKHYDFNKEKEIRFLKSFITGHGLNKNNPSLLVRKDENGTDYFSYKIPILSKENIENDFFKGPKMILPDNANPVEIKLNGNPCIIIEKVILGPNYNEKDLEKLKDLEVSLNEKTGFINQDFGKSSIKIELSTLKK